MRHKSGRLDIHTAGIFEYAREPWPLETNPPMRLGYLRKLPLGLCLADDFWPSQKPLIESYLEVFQDIQVRRKIDWVGQDVRIATVCNGDGPILSALSKL
jgi:hypothetical protein